MMVAYGRDIRLVHSTFTLLPIFLEPEDLLVINTSGTLPAAIPGLDAHGRTAVMIHLSTQLAQDLWVVEPRLPGRAASERWPAERGAPPSEVLLGEDGSRLELLEPYLGSTRLWVARMSVPGKTLSWLTEHGRPIRYGYAEQPWPVSAYQNVYATEPGSAEMPSAGRPFTPEMITSLVAKGVGITPIVLHTGVASLESDELPYPEKVRVPPVTAERVNATRAAGGRVVAVGTTVVRALESAYNAGLGRTVPVDGWTDLVITPARGVKVVDGLLTGWHEPEASHLLMLEAIAGRDLLEKSYEASLHEGYLWHEFGDVHLLLP